MVFTAESCPIEHSAVMECSTSALVPYNFHELHEYLKYGGCDPGTKISILFNFN